jgi:hypothetical protein
MDGEVEEFVAGMVGVCPWMTEEDVRVVREVVSAHLGLVVGRVVDLGRMAGLLLWLAERADAMGDARRAWAFDRWYAWACAAMRGEEYHWPELPQVLEVLP